MNELNKIEDYLSSHHVSFEVLTHERAATSMEAARLAHIEPQRLVKAVLLEGDDCLMAAMIPANCDVSLDMLKDDFGEHIHLADETTIRNTFLDCDPGAVPGLTKAWGVDMVWDDELLAQPDLYLEAGDHMHLLHVQTHNLMDVLADAPHCHFVKSSTVH